MDDPWTLDESVIIEDDVCELCDERALPYNAASQDSYCAKHQMVWETGQALEDYTESYPEDTEKYLLRRLNTALTENGACCILGCEHSGYSRIENDSVPELLVACTQCAGHIFLGHFLLDRSTWVMLLTDEIIDQ